MLLYAKFAVFAFNFTLSISPNFAFTAQHTLHTSLSQQPRNMAALSAPLPDPSHSIADTVKQVAGLAVSAVKQVLPSNTTGSTSATADAPASPEVEAATGGNETTQLSRKMAATRKFMVCHWATHRPCTHTAVLAATLTQL